MARKNYDGNFGVKIVEIADYIGVSVRGLGALLDRIASIRGYANGDYEPPLSLFWEIKELIKNRKNEELNPGWFFGSDVDMIIKETSDQKKITELGVQIKKLNEEKSQFVVILHNSNKIISEEVNRLIAGLAIYPDTIENEH